jgi:alpha-amylase/alpha-mannosidase (GH57 family)
VLLSGNGQRETRNGERFNSLSPARRKYILENYICIHAHFYQPPRENPWLEAIEHQESAYPYHDWNQKITAECYQPNSVARILDKNGRIDRLVNNYSRISFNFGPTLLSWLAVEDPATYCRIIEADRESRERFSGHGSALAQAYNHPLLPLCNHRDKITQIQWGIRDFTHRFGRAPEGMWLPETAADLETLEVMAEMDLKFAILAPHQARRVRKRGESTWHTTSDQSLDSSMPYEICLPSGRRLALFFYNGPISLAVGFQRLLSDGEIFMNRLTGAFSAESERPQIVHIAVDGETFGHHHRFGEMALAYALQSIESGAHARLTNYGEYLEKHPPTHLVDIWENTSWSCAHGIGRWQENCGCSTGAHPGWQQQWRTPLREGLNWLRDRLDNLFDSDAAALLIDPWAARNDYIGVILDRSSESVERFLSNHKTHELSPEERVRVLKLMELQRHAMLMYTSCGWFFDDISGIEAIQVLQYAGRAIQLGEALFGKDNIESSFLEILRKAPSNNPEAGNGRDIYQKFVKPAIVDRNKAIGHYAISSLFQDYPEQSEIYSYFVERKRSKIIAIGKSKLAAGRCKITSQITSESVELEYSVMHLGDHNISGGVRECKSANSEEEIINEMPGAFERADLSEVFRLIDRFFGQSVFSLKSLFKDEQRRVLDIILKSAHAELEELNRQGFERMAPLMSYLMNLGMTLPAYFKNIAASVINADLQRAFEEREFNADHAKILLESAAFWHVDLESDGLEYALRGTIEKLMQEVHGNPGNLPVLRKFASAVRLALKLPFTINFYRTQNCYYEALRGRYPELKAASEKLMPNAKIWAEEFKEIGMLLSVKVE